MYYAISLITIHCPTPRCNPKVLATFLNGFYQKATKTTSPIHFVVHNCYGTNPSTCTHYGPKKSGTFETDIYLKWCVLELDRMDVWERDDQMIPLGCYFSTINKFLGWNVQKGTNYMSDHQEDSRGYYRELLESESEKKIVAKHKSSDFDWWWGNLFFYSWSGQCWCLVLEAISDTILPYFSHLNLNMNKHFEHVLVCCGYFLIHISS